MHFLLALLALKSATVIDVQTNHGIAIALAMDDTIYTAEFSPHDLKGQNFAEGDHVQAEVKNGRCNSGTAPTSRHTSSIAPSATPQVFY
jgi:hypothetical protein